MTKTEGVNIARVQNRVSTGKSNPGSRHEEGPHASSPIESGLEQRACRLKTSERTRGTHGLLAACLLARDSGCVEETAVVCCARYCRLRASKAHGVMAIQVSSTSTSVKCVQSKPWFNFTVQTTGQGRSGPARARSGTSRYCTRRIFVLLPSM